MPETTPTNATQTWRDRCRGFVYLIILLLGVLPVALAAGLCLLVLIVDGTNPWTRPVVLALALLLATLAVTVLVVLNRRIPIRATAPHWGGFVFWLGWSMPLLLLAWTVALGIAAALGFQIDASGSSTRGHWDWD